MLKKSKYQYYNLNTTLYEFFNGCYNIRAMHILIRIKTWTQSKFSLVNELKKSEALVATVKKINVETFYEPLMTKQKEILFDEMKF